MKTLRTFSLSLLVLGAMSFFSGISEAATITGGTTSVALNGTTVNALVGLGFGIAPITPSTLTGLNAVFPITGGDSTMQIFHSGGLAFTKGGTTLNLTNFTINLLNNTLFATANGSANQIAFLDLGAGGALTLDSVAGGALASTFGVPNLTGASIGTATVNAVVSPEPSTVGLVALSVLALGATARRRKSETSR